MPSRTLKLAASAGCNLFIVDPPLQPMSAIVPTLQYNRPER
jgi:hypothetical protein